MSLRAELEKILEQGGEQNWKGEYEKLRQQCEQQDLMIESLNVTNQETVQEYETKLNELNRKSERLKKKHKEEMQELRQSLKEKEDENSRLKSTISEQESHISTLTTKTKWISKTHIVGFVLVLIVGFVASYAFGSVRYGAKIDRAEEQVEQMEQKLKSAETNVYRAKEGIQLYDAESHEKEDGWFDHTMILTGDVFRVTDEGKEWSIVRTEGETYAVKTADLSKSERETVDLS